MNLIWPRINWFQKRRLNRDLLPAAFKGETEQVRRLLDAGASANAVAHCRTALDIAGRSPWSDVTTVRLLLERGALVNGDPKRKTQNPLRLASHSSDDDRIRTLITHGADVNALQPSMGTGLTPLQELVRWAEIKTLQLLLQQGADINQRSVINENLRCGGNTALHVAATVPRPDVVRFLLNSGADMTLRNVQGKSALDSARETSDLPHFRSKKYEKQAQAFRETIVLLEEGINPCRNH